MKKALLLCVCQGTCPSFHDMNTMEILNRIRREKLVDMVALHPQLCADDGDIFLSSFLKDNEITHLFVAGCDISMQKKMFRDAFEKANFDKAKHFGVDIRNMNTDQATDTIKKLISEVK
ncbi:MAG: heterodisulfide reductase subunit A-like protein [Myxococcota bacterium]